MENIYTMVVVKTCPHTHTTHQFMGFDEDRAIEVSDLDAHHLPISQCVIIIKRSADEPAREDISLVAEEFGCKLNMCNRKQFSF